MSERKGEKCTRQTHHGVSKQQDLMKGTELVKNFNG